VFILTLGLLWAQLWKQDPKTYLPFLTAGMLAWGLVSTIITEGCVTFTMAEGLIKSLRFSYIILPCAVVWRNLIVLLHNLIIFVAVMIYAAVPITWNSLLILPGLLLVAINGVWPEQLGPGFSKFVDYNVLFHYVDIVRSPLLERASSLLSWEVVIAGTVLGWWFTMFAFSRFRARIPYWI
jgi:ABC-type polysaccharide/polyol phosphate export permease